MSAAASAALLYVYAYSPQQTDQRVPASESSASPSAMSGERHFLPEAGYRYIYSFRRGLSFEGNLGGVGMPAVGFTGEFYIDVLRADKAGFEAVVSEKIQGAPAPRAPFARIEAGVRGDRLSFFKAEGLNEDEAQHVSVVKDLVSLWLFPLRADTVGDFEARFDPLPAEPGFAREKKVKLAYRSHAPNTPAILSSEHYLLWEHALHLPKEVKGEEKTRLGNGPAALVADSRYELRFRDREKSPPLGASLLAGLSTADDLGLDLQRTPSLADHPDYKNLDWGKLLSSLAGIGSLEGMKQLALFGDINRFLRLHPERVADLAALLRDPALLKAGTDSAVFKTIVGALATAGGAEALAALRDAYSSADLAPAGKTTILAAMTTTQAPIDSPTREFLEDKMKTETDPHLAQSAGYALGSALQNAANDTQAANAIQNIMSRFAASRDVNEQLALLDVMGNSGRSEFLPTLEGVLNAGTYASNVKAKAEFSLRFIKAPAATADLLRGLVASQSSLRDAAASAIGIADWTEAFRAPLESCASSDSETRIRASCTSTLGSHPRVADAQ